VQLAIINKQCEQDVPEPERYRFAPKELDRRIRRREWIDRRDAARAALGQNAAIAHLAAHLSCHSPNAAGARGQVQTLCSFESESLPRADDRPGSSSASEAASFLLLFSRS
jgi:hypothetical protein